MMKDIGLVGVGRMGGGILRRLTKNNVTVWAHDTSSSAKHIIEESGGNYAATLTELVQNLSKPRIIWLMIPAGQPVRETIAALSELLEPEDTVIDGGNSHYKEAVTHYDKLAKRDITFIDVGMSGGVAGEETGYALMVGGDQEQVASMQSLFALLAAPDASAHVGPAGAGHFVKMVHNAVEYGMMQAIGEGFDLLKRGPYEKLNLGEIATMWSHGTIVRSYLMELAARALTTNENLAGIASYVDDSGEGRWSVEAAVDHAVPFWVNTAALYARFNSRQPDAFSAKVIAALRREFGGHSIKSEEE